MKGKIIAAAVIVLSIGAFAGYKLVFSKSEPDGIPVNTAMAMRGTIEESISLKAPLEGTESIDVVSSLHYEVLNITVKEGDRVTKGQVLAELDTSSLQKDIASIRDEIELLQVQHGETVSDASRQVSLAEAQLEEKIRDRQKEYDKLAADLSEAERQYSNIKSLYDSGAETSDNLTKAGVEVDNIKRSMAAYNAVDGRVVAEESDLKSIENLKNAPNTASAQKQIQIRRNELARKQEDLQDCIIKSTIDGTVTRVYSRVGRLADETGDDSHPMFVIENIDKLQMKVSVSEYDISKIKIGQRAIITADILEGQETEGVVSSISPTGEQKSGTTERIIPVTIDITGDKSKLIAGINTTARIQINRSEDTIYIPQETVLDNGDGTFSVYRVSDENKIEIIPVELGVEDDINIEVIGGINEGDRIVMSPTPNLTEGLVVMDMSAPAPTDGETALDESSGSDSGDKDAESSDDETESGGNDDDASDSGESNSSSDAPADENSESEVGSDSSTDSGSKEV